MPLEGVCRSDIMEIGHFRLIKQVGSFLHNNVNTNGFLLPTVFLGKNNFSFALSQEAVFYLKQMVGKGFKYKLNSCRLAKWVFGELEVRYHYQQISLNACMRNALLARMRKGEKSFFGVDWREESWGGGSCLTHLSITTMKVKDSLCTLGLLLCGNSCLPAW